MKEYGIKDTQKRKETKMLQKIKQYRNENIYVPSYNEWYFGRGKFFLPQCRNFHFRKPAHHLF